jgi:uncharacterized protein with PQ loop repeat
VRPALTRYKGESDETCFNNTRPDRRLGFGTGTPAFAQDKAADKPVAAAPATAAAPAATTAAPAPAEAKKVEPNKGDTAWMIVATALVLMMSIPGLALFYGGLVRTKNMLSVLMQVFVVCCLLTVLWFVYGYTIAFTEGNAFFGGFDRLFLKGLTPDSTSATFSKGVMIPEYIYMVFQCTFAIITPCLIVGAFAERMKFSAVLMFMVLWFTFSYLPIAHMVWFWAGPTRTPTPQPQTKRRPLPVSSSRKARSISRAEQWCTSTPVSQVSWVHCSWVSASAMAGKRWRRTA